LVSFSRWSPLLLLALAPWIWWLHVTGRSGLGRWRARLALLSRLLLLAALAVTLCEPRMVRRDERMTIVFALDHSASITTEATQGALRFVLNAVAGKPAQDRAGLVFFGRDASVELPPSVVLPFEAINVSIDREGTNLAAGLALGAALLPLEHQGRIVLVSDG